MRYRNGFPEYVSVADKKAKATQKLQQLRKKNPAIAPVVLQGSALAGTWWGKAWNRNLERYADYGNRIGRGRSYVRHGTVLDLQIAAGRVTALVQGTRARPYEVEITIKAIPAARWAAVKKQCHGQLKSLQDLLAGKFPKELGEIFFGETTGLFPSPKEIAFKCSCPDWASMCKHVAAALYGTGARLDENPALFFTLRWVKVDDLVAGAIQDKTTELLAKAGKKSARRIDGEDLSALFGIELAAPPVAPAACGEGKTDRVEKPAAKVAAGAAGKVVRESRSRPSLSPLDQVAALIVRYKYGVDTNTLAEKTGFAKAQIYALVHRLKRQGKVKNKAHGVYVKN